MIRTARLTSIQRSAAIFAALVCVLALASLIGAQAAEAHDSARGRHGYGDHHYSHRYDHYDHHDHRGYGHDGYRDYDRDSDSGHYVGHGYDYRHQGYYCSRCHYHTPSRHVFFEHLHHHHHIPWYEAVSYLVWSPIHLVFVFD